MYLVLILLYLLSINPFNDAKKLAWSKKYDASIKILEKMESERKLDTQKLYFLGKVYFWNNNYEKAYRIYKNSYSSFSTSENFLYEYSLILKHLVKQNKQLRILKRLTSLYPDNNRNLLLYLNCIKKNNSFKVVYNFFESKNNFQKTFFWNKQFIQFLTENQLYALGIEKLRQLPEPSNYKFSELGKLYYWRKEFTKAEQSYSKISNYLFGSDLIRYINVLIELKKYEIALSIIRKKIKPVNKILHRKLADILHVTNSLNEVSYIEKKINQQKRTKLKMSLIKEFGYFTEINRKNLSSTVSFNLGTIMRSSLNLYDSYLEQNKKSVHYQRVVSNYKFNISDIDLSMNIGLYKIRNKIIATAKYQLNYFYYRKNIISLSINRLLNQNSIQTVMTNLVFTRYFFSGSYQFKKLFFTTNFSFDNYRKNISSHKIRFLFILPCKFGELFITNKILSSYKTFNKSLYKNTIDTFWQAMRLVKNEFSISLSYPVHESLEIVTKIKRSYNSFKNQNIYINNSYYIGLNIRSINTTINYSYSESILWRSDRFSTEFSYNF